MDPATFVVTTLAVALINEVATDSYKAVKVRLVNVFGLGTAVEMLEEAASDEDTRDFAAKKLAKSSAIEDAEVSPAPLGARRLIRMEPDRPAAAFLEAALLGDPRSWRYLRNMTQDVCST